MQDSGDFGSISVIDLNQIGKYRSQFTNLFFVFQLLTLPGGNFCGRCHGQYITLETFVQTFGLQNNIQSLIPGHILQTQGHIATNGV